MKSLTCRRRKFKKAGIFGHLFLKLMSLCIYYKDCFFKRNMFHDLHLSIFANSKFGRCKMLLFLSNPYVKKLFTEYLKQSICFVKATLFVVCKLNPSHNFDNLTTCDQGCSQCDFTIIFSLYKYLNAGYQL